MSKILLLILNTIENVPSRVDEVVLAESTTKLMYMYIYTCRPPDSTNAGQWAPVSQILDPVPVLLLINNKH